jgi:hypothetical protein
VQRAFDGLRIAVNGDGAECAPAASSRTPRTVLAWVRSYVSDARTRSFCVHEAPAPEAVHSGS